MARAQCAHWLRRPWIGQQAGIQNMYSSSIKCPLSTVHCLSKTKQNKKRWQTQRLPSIKVTSQSGAWHVIVTSWNDHGLPNYHRLQCKLAYLLSKSLFAFRNTNAFRCWDDKEARRRLQTPPATENTRSNGADVAGIARYLRARTASTSSQANRN